MASSQVEMERSNKQLKYLGVVRVLTLNALLLVRNLYDSAKRNSGSLKSTVYTVENAVTTVVGPVYERVKGLPGDLLLFLDKKVDETVHKLDGRAPPAVKNVLSLAELFMKKASHTALDFAEEAKVAGPLAAVTHAGKISQNFAVNQLAVVWYKLNQHQAFRGASKMVIPAAAKWSDKYNKLVKDVRGKGSRLFNYVPLVPVEEMANAYAQVESRVRVSSSESESDED